MRARAALLVLFALAASGCASIMHGTTQQVSVSSNPSQAEVTVNGHQVGRTPIVMDLRRKDHHSLRLELAGYQPYEMTITRSTSGWVAGNIVFGGLIGLAIDASNGAMYKLSPEAVSAEMRADGVSAATQGGALVLTIVLEPEPGWELIGHLSAR